MGRSETPGYGATVSGVTAAYQVIPADGPIRAIVRPPGSKSETNRALVLGALASNGVTRLWGALEADDTRAMRGALRSLGVMVDDNDDPWMVLGTGGELTAPDQTIDVGASGTTARFITAVAALVKGPVEIDGTARMRERPIGHLTDALIQLGANVEAGGGTPPVRLNGGGLVGGSVAVDGSQSSQFVSAVLMIAPMLDEPTRIEVTGELVSGRYVAGTVNMMRRFGAEVAVGDNVYEVAPSRYRKTHLHIEADASAASYPLVAAAISGGEMEIEGIPSDSTQPDLAILDVLEEMGCRVLRTDDRLNLYGPDRALSAVDVDMERAPDASLAVAVACLFADGQSRISGLSTLRVKETDRLEALHTEINRLGATAVIEGDSLVVKPGPLQPTLVKTYDDHRMAMSFALVGLMAPGIEIDDPGCVSKTWPDYFRVLEAISG